MRCDREKLEKELHEARDELAEAIDERAEAIEERDAAIVERDEANAERCYFLSHRICAPIAEPSPQVERRSSPPERRLQERRVWRFAMQGRRHIATIMGRRSNDPDYSSGRRITHNDPRQTTGRRDYDQGSPVATLKVVNAPTQGDDPQAA